VKSVVYSKVKCVTTSVLKYKTSLSKSQELKKLLEVKNLLII